MITIFQKNYIATSKKFNQIFIDAHSLGVARKLGYMPSDLTTTDSIDEESGRSFSDNGVNIILCNPDRDYIFFDIPNSQKVLSEDTGTPMNISLIHKSSIIGFTTAHPKLLSENAFGKKADLELYLAVVSASMLGNDILIITEDGRIKTYIRMSDQYF